MMTQTIIFNHIPRTGGTTLRIILNKVYGEEHIFFIKSKDIKSSLDEFRNMSLETRKKYKVISGHGSNLFLDLVESPFRICVLREPVSMFISQYHYLRESNNSNFLEEVKELLFKEYIDYASNNNQDNMLTRFLNESHEWLINPNLAHLDTHKAKESLYNYDAIINLSTFDEGVYALSQLLKWKTIPLYKRSNRSSINNRLKITQEETEILYKILKPDIDIYTYFINSNLNTASMYKPNFIFRLRQFLIRNLIS